jgi:hypothetical protein
MAQIISNQLEGQQNPPPGRTRCPAPKGRAVLTSRHFFPELIGPAFKDALVQPW